jgi:hypothetical protein
MILITDQKSDFMMSVYAMAGIGRIAQHSSVLSFSLNNDHMNGCCQAKQHTTHRMIVQEFITFMLSHAHKQ